ncbi:MAG: GxxExxY protein, partial [Bryobacteraceae bacterium]
YEGHCVGRNQADLVVGSGDEAIIVELKAAPCALGPPEKQQLSNYMKSLNIKKGLLINFPQPERPRRKFTEPGPEFDSVVMP